MEAGQLGYKMGYSLVYTTAKDKEQARKLGRILIKEKLVACINFFPINAMYPWKGKIEEENEVGMLLKTRGKLVNKVIKRIKELHSYDVPCIISLPVMKGNKDFFKWIKQETK